ncbi:hypothetical protein BDY19DRAFT_909874 [Irpex rosettiformis]|uniref:Uncharacterized protein n=1 Tax=Irpex rosettiformis TaxID=378272 RepID=A0ACB8TQZ2_9APHY|nr:hypothetical protein BDY19DRAFT_909874 [Irpex rosettiformis]
MSEKLPNKPYHWVLHHNHGEFHASYIFCYARICTLLSQFMDIGSCLSTQHGATIGQHLSLALCVAAISSDIIVLLVTWYRTIGTYLETRKLNIKTPLLFCLLRDAYINRSAPHTPFNVQSLSLLFIIHIVQLLSVVYINKQAIPGYLPNMLLLFIPIVICRFLLNLREVGLSRTQETNPIDTCDVQVVFELEQGWYRTPIESVRSCGDTSSHLFDEKPRSHLREPSLRPPAVVPLTTLRLAPLGDLATTVIYFSIRNILYGFHAPHLYFRAPWRLCQTPEIRDLRVLALRRPTLGYLLRSWPYLIVILFDFESLTYQYGTPLQRTAADFHSTSFFPTLRTIPVLRSHIHFISFYAATTSIMDWEQSCGACGEPNAPKRCSGCHKAWYCNKECQENGWTLHIFDCKRRRPINTADRLAQAVFQDLLPTDPQTRKDWGIDKANLIYPDGPYMIFGLLAGLIKYCNVKPIQLHKWRLQGRLIPEIKAIYEAIPAQARGGYYPWFLEHQYVLEDPEVKSHELTSAADEMRRRAWVAIGGSPTASSATIVEYIQGLPPDRGECFLLYSLLHSSGHPGPDVDIYLNFGFCVCPTQYEEMGLGRAYKELVDACTFDDFCNAYANNTLMKLFETHGVTIQRVQVHLLADVLSGEPTKSVWKLKQWIASGGEGKLVLSATFDYGFKNCSNDEDRKQLFALYKAFFESGESDPLKLHATCIEGHLFRFFADDVKMALPGSRELFERLLKNLYPLSAPPA